MVKLIERLLTIAGMIIMAIVIVGIILGIMVFTAYLSNLLTNAIK